MVSLHFNQELSLFVEEEDPLQSSLHLEDLPSLQSSGSEISDENTEEKAVAKKNLPMLPGEDGKRLVDNILASECIDQLKHTMNNPKALGSGTFNGTEIDVYASLPAPPSFENDYLEKGEGLEKKNPIINTCLKTQTVLKIESEETEQAMTPQSDSQQLSEKAKMLNKLRSPNFRRKQHARYKELNEGTCSYDIPHASASSKNSNVVKKVLRETSAIRFSPHLDNDDVSSTCASKSTSSITAGVPSAFSEKSNATSRVAVRKQDRNKRSKVGKKIRGDRPDLSGIDSVSNVSVASTNSFSSRVAGRLSKAFTPRWAARWKIESEAKKKVIVVDGRTGDHKENSKTKPNHDGTSSYDVSRTSIKALESKKEVQKLQSPARLKNRSKSLQHVKKPKSLTAERRSISDTKNYSTQYRYGAGMNAGTKSIVIVSPKKHNASNRIGVDFNKNPPLRDNDENDVSYHINHFPSPSVRTIEVPRYTFDDDKSVMSAASSLGTESVSSGNASNTWMASTPKSRSKESPSSEKRSYRTPSKLDLSVNNRHTAALKLSPLTPEPSQISFGSQYFDQPQTPSSNNGLSRSNSGRKTFSLDPCPSPYSVDSSCVSDVASTASSYTALSSLSFRDPCAKQSKIVKRSNLDVSGKGDCDIWVEKIFVSKRTGKRRTFFVSVATGRRMRDEPPTGASKVIYSDDLKELTKEEVRMTVPSFINLTSC